MEEVCILEYVVLSNFLTFLVTPIPNIDVPIQYSVFECIELFGKFIVFLFCEKLEEKLMKLPDRWQKIVKVNR